MLLVAIASCYRNWNKLRGYSARMQTLSYLAGLFQTNCFKYFDRGSGLRIECVGLLSLLRVALYKES